MEKQPKAITACTLDCVLMPQGEIISLGKTLGWFKEFKEHLKPQSVHDELLDAAKQAFCGNMGWKGKLNDAIANAEPGK